MTNKSINHSCDTVVVCVVGINLDFKIFTYTLATCLKSIRLITQPSSLAHDVPFTVRVLSIVFHVLSVMFAISLEYLHSTSKSKL